jgi:monoamine oxidase
LRIQNERKKMSQEPEPIEDRYTNMDTDKLKDLLKRRYGFEDDEIKTLFDTDDKMRDALREFKKAATPTKRDDENVLGWDEEDSQDLTVDQQTAVENKKLMVKKVERIRKKRQKQLAQIKGEELQESIAEAGNKVTPEEVRSASKDIKKLFEEDEPE